MDYAGGEVIVTPDGNGDYLYYLCVAPSTTGDKLTDDTKFEPTDMATLGYMLDAEYADTIEAYPMLSINNSNSPLGSLLAASSNEGEYTEGYCDDSGVSAASLDCVYGGGYAYGSADAAPSYGLACVYADDFAFGGARASIGSRLCYTNAE